MALKRVLSSVDAAWLVAGSMIGSGIFITPGLVVERLPGFSLPLLAWLVGGLVALAGAAVYAELGSRIPRAGGDYQFLAEAFGPLAGFMNGWAAITLTFSAAAAAQTRAALEYVAAAIPALDHPALVLLAPPTILLLTWANTVGARVAGRTTALFTALPLGVLVGLFLFGVISRPEAVAWPELTESDGPTIGAWGLALIPIFFTYSGWNAAAYLAGEMRDPGKSLGRGLLAGTGAVVLVYLAVNVALLLTLPPETFASSTRPAADAIGLLLGGSGETVLALMIAAAILGSANVTLMAGARVYYAMSADGMGPAALARINRSGVPAMALWAGGAWSCLLAVIGDISELVSWATLAILLLSSLTVASLFVLRRRDPRPAEFRCPGYPLTPLVYLVASLGAGVSSYLYNPRNALVGLAIIAAGFPIYFAARSRFRPAGSDS